MLSVTFRKLTDGKVVTAGTLAWDGANFTLFPADSILLQRVLREPVRLTIGGGLKKVSAKRNPRVFMEGLHQHYRGAYLFADKAKKWDGEVPNG